MSIPTPPRPLQKPKTHILQPGKRLVRFYDPGGRRTWIARRSFGPLEDQRFDHHPLPKGDSSPESVWYASGSLIGAVAESFGRLGVIDKNCGGRICVVNLSVPFEVVNLYGVGPRHLGLDQEICTTSDYEITQQWARALYNRFPDLVGIRWRGRQMSSENVVLTDRADLSTLALLGDYEISEAAVWPRIANAARNCRIKIV